MPTTTIRRLFGIVDDATSGGKSYDDLEPQAADSLGYTKAVPDASIFWPVTGGTLEYNVERITRETEVRLRRANTSPLPFRGAPVVTVPGPAYPSVIAKLFKKALGGADTVTGSAGDGYTHSFASITGQSASGLPSAHVQMIRDDLNQKVSGASVNRFALTFPLDGEGTFEAEFWGKWVKGEPVAFAVPTPSYTGLGDDVLMLRDARAYIDTQGARTYTSGTNAVGAATLTVDDASAFSAGPATIRVTTPGGAGQDDVVQFLSYTAKTGTSFTGIPVSGAGSIFVAIPADSFVAEPVSLTSDLNTIEFTWVNNLIRKFYPGMNIQTRQLMGTNIAGGQDLRKIRKVWWPEENRLGAAQDVTFAFGFQSVSQLQELALVMGQIQQFVFEFDAGPITGTTPPANVMLRIILYNAEYTGGGADALSARDDVTSRFEGTAYYADALATDVVVQIIDAQAAAYT